VLGDGVQERWHRLFAGRAPDRAGRRCAGAVIEVAELSDRVLQLRGRESFGSGGFLRAQV
jgi:hypothetical protein